MCIYTHISTYILFHLSCTNFAVKLFLSRLETPVVPNWLLKSLGIRWLLLTRLNEPWA